MFDLTELQEESISDELLEEYWEAREQARALIAPVYEKIQAACLATLTELPKCPACDASVERQKCMFDMGGSCPRHGVYAQYGGKEAVMEHLTSLEPIKSIAAYATTFLDAWEAGNHANGENFCIYKNVEDAKAEADDGDEIVVVAVTLSDMKEGDTGFCAVIENTEWEPWEAGIFENSVVAEIYHSYEEAMADTNDHISEYSLVKVEYHKAISNESKWAEVE